MLNLESNCTYTEHTVVYQSKLYKLCVKCLLEKLVLSFKNATWFEILPNWMIFVLGVFLYKSAWLNPLTKKRKLFCFNAVATV